MAGRRSRVNVGASLHYMLKRDLIKTVQEERQKNALMAISNDQLKTAFKYDIDVAIKKNQELTAERDSLRQQLQQDMSLREAQEVQKRNELIDEQIKIEFKRDLDVANKKNQELTAERDSLLQQLQNEISMREALRLKLLEHEQSHQSIVDSVIEVHTSREQEMSLQIDELTKHCRDYLDEKDHLAEKLEQIAEENSCAICLEPWAAQGDHRIVSLPCGHLYGKKCILQHFSRRSECPICKQVQSGRTQDIFGRLVLPIHRPEAQTAQVEHSLFPRQPAPNPVQPISRPIQPAAQTDAHTAAAGSTSSGSTLFFTFGSGGTSGSTS